VYADGSAEYEGVVGSRRVQGNRLLLTQEGETVAYNFTLQGSKLTLSGGDLMAPMVMTRAGGGGAARAPTTGLPETEETDGPIPPPVEESRRAVQPDNPPVGQRRENGLYPSLSCQACSRVSPSRRLSSWSRSVAWLFPLTRRLARLKSKGASNELIGALQQAEDRSGAGTISVPSRSNPLAGSASGGRASGTPASSRGPRFNHEKWGISFVTPSGWKVGERQGLLLMGSDTEAGLIVIRLARQATLEQLIQDYGGGMQEEGLQLMPTMQAHDFPAGRNRAVAGELAGVAQDGHESGLTVAVASPYGDAAVVLGMTTEEKYSGLATRRVHRFQFSIQPPRLLRCWKLSPDSGSPSAALPLVPASVT
jgi:hypothetical protein